MGKERKSFVFNCEWQEVLMEYPAEVRLEVYDAIIGYVASGKLSELKPLAKMAFSFIRKEIDYNQSKYEEAAGKNRENGRKGGNPNFRKGKPNPYYGDGLPKITEDNPTLPKITLYDNDNEYDNDNDSSTGVEEEKEPPSPPYAIAIDEEIATLKAETAWLDQLRMLHRMDADALRLRLDEFRLHCKANGQQRHESISDAKQHFNNWLRIKNYANGKSHGTSATNRQTGSTPQERYGEAAKLINRLLAEDGGGGAAVRHEGEPPPGLQP